MTEGRLGPSGRLVINVALLQPWAAVRYPCVFKVCREIKHRINAAFWIYIPQYHPLRRGCWLQCLTLLYVRLCRLRKAEHTPSEQRSMFGCVLQPFPDPAFGYSDNRMRLWSCSSWHKEVFGQWDDVSHLWKTCMSL